MQVFLLKNIVVALIIFYPLLLTKVGFTVGFDTTTTEGTRVQQFAPLPDGIVALIKEKGIISVPSHY